MRSRQLGGPHCLWALFSGRMQGEGWHLGHQVKAHKSLCRAGRGTHGRQPAAKRFLVQVRRRPCASGPRSNAAGGVCLAARRHAQQRRRTRPHGHARNVCFLAAWPAHLGTVACACAAGGSREQGGKAMQAARAQPRMRMHATEKTRRRVWGGGRAAGTRWHEWEHGRGQWGTGVQEVARARMHGAARGPTLPGHGAGGHQHAAALCTTVMKDQHDLVPTQLCACVRPSSLAAQAGGEGRQAQGRAEPAARSASRLSEGRNIAIVGGWPTKAGAQGATWNSQRAVNLLNRQSAAKSDPCLARRLAPLKGCSHARGCSRRRMLRREPPSHALPSDLHPQAGWCPPWRSPVAARRGGVQPNRLPH